MKAKHILLGGLMLCGLAAMADYPSGYYNAIDGKKGVTLKKAAKSAVKNHTVIPYGSGMDHTWGAFQTTDVRMVNGRLCWWDMYSNDNVPVEGNGTPGTGMNIEHSVANSWWGGTKNDAYKDLFLLNPSNAAANSRKSNYPLAELASVTWDNGVTFVGKPKSGMGGGSANAYEPCDEYKGDFARGLMYIFTVYDDIKWKDQYDWMYDKSSDLTLQTWAYEMLLRWAKNDPVSQKEVDRNEAVYKIQKNRNPYIDFPELCEYVWGAKQSETFSLANAVRPEFQPGEGGGGGGGNNDDPVTPVEPNKGEWTKVMSVSDIDDECDYIFVSSKTEHVMGCANNNAYFAEVGQASFRGDVVTQVPSGAALVKMIPSGFDYKFGIYDMEGDFKGYLDATGEKQVGLNTSAAAVPAASLTIMDGQMIIDFGEPGKFYYNASAPRFTTYSKSAQEPISLYKLHDTGTAVHSIMSELPVGTIGNDIVGPEECRVFNLQGVEVGRKNLPAGFYIVVTPSTNRSVKVIVR